VLAVSADDPGRVTVVDDGRDLNVAAGPSEAQLGATHLAQTLDPPHVRPGGHEVLDAVDGDRKHEHSYRPAGLLVAYRQFPCPSHVYADARQTDYESLGPTADCALTVHWRAGWSR
jgi:hypothetical protein